MKSRPGRRSRLRFASRFVLLSFCLAATVGADGNGSGGGALRAGPAFANDVEGALVRAIVSLRDSGLRRALDEIDRALDRTPNYRLAHLVKGDMLMARAGKPVAFASLAAPATDVAPLQEEAKVRLQRYLDAPPVDYLPAPVLQLAEPQKHVLLVDTSRSRLFVYANDLGRPRYVTDFYISLGKNGVEKTREGDQKTPLGVYTITAARDRLPDFYGAGAFPIDYPNDWDRMHGRKGHGIWLHGTPSETYARPPLATDGCVVLANDDYRKLARYVDVSRTPVVIGQSLAWRDPSQWESQRESFMAAFERWRTDWESRDAERYFSHYASTFKAEGNLAAWKAQKRRVNASKQWVKVKVRNLSVFAYPGAADTVVATFEQDYRSSNLSSRGTKRQYWVREGRHWRIAHEDFAS